MNTPTVLFFYRILSANQLICKVNQYEYGREYEFVLRKTFFPTKIFNFPFLIFN